MHECRNFRQHEYHIILAPNLAAQIDISVFPDYFTFHLIKKRPASNLINFLVMMLWYRAFERRIKPDCIISTGGHGYWKPKVPVVGGFNIPHYVYPESPYFRNLSLKKRVYWKFMRLIHLHLYNRLDAVLVQTEDVKLRLSRILSSGAPIHVISNTASAHFFSKSSFLAKLPARVHGETRLLTLSSYYPHKNLEVINRVTQIFKERGEARFKFILTLPDEQYRLAFGTNDTGLIFNTGPVPIRECPSLYDECDIMFLPTLLECFSASYAEAMVMKKPILTSDMSFARTVCLNAAVYFNPLDPEEIAGKISELAGDSELQNRLINEGESIARNFNTPYERADTFLKICQEVLELH
ncbi:MAG: glycosyltransferase [Bacteroidales bacterium]|nr:glycosyltransferase [Bacteroidales bacterium]